jgi:hypothetical protein
MSKSKGGITYTQPSRKHNVEVVNKVRDDLVVKSQHPPK